jgi:hypothetical protein
MTDAVQSNVRHLGRSAGMGTAADAMRRIFGIVGASLGNLVKVGYLRNVPRHPDLPHGGLRVKEGAATDVKLIRW